MGFDSSKVPDMSDEELQRTANGWQSGTPEHTVCKREQDRRQWWKTLWTNVITILATGLVLAVVGVLLGKYL